jgi:hypothetical protein
MSPDGAVRQAVETPQSTATYYPGVSVLGQAEAIEVGEGEERTAIDFGLARWQPVRLTVTFVDSKGALTNGSAVLLGASDATVRPLPRGLPFASAQTTTAVDPGVWTIYAFGPAGVANTGVTVGSSDVTVTVVLRPGARLSGRVVTDAGVLPAGSAVDVIAPYAELGMFAPMDATSHMSRSGRPSVGPGEHVGPPLRHADATSGDAKRSVRARSWRMPSSMRSAISRSCWSVRIVLRASCSMNSSCATFSAT